MAFDAALAERIRVRLASVPGVTEMKMFGGVGFLLNGNMCAGVWKDALVARVGPEQYAAARKLPGVSEFDVTGRPMTGWVLVEPDAVDSESALREWLARCVDYAGRLPPK